MMYSARFVIKEDYETLKQWWIDWNWSPVPPAFLPVNGLMVSNDNDICAGWVYKTDTPICWIEHIISDKNSKDRGAVVFLIQMLEELAKDLGFKVAMTSIKNASLMRKMEDLGYQKSDTEMTNYVKGL